MVHDGTSWHLLNYPNQYLKEYRLLLLALHWEDFSYIEYRMLHTVYIIIHNNRMLFISFQSTTEYLVKIHIKPPLLWDMEEYFLS